MRIKFRAWLIDEKEIASVASVNWSINAYKENIYISQIICDNRMKTGEFSFRGSYSFGSFELMQYTGLKDKNGVEIYEGDIVLLVDLSFGNLGCYEVEFNDESAGFVMYFNQEIRHFIDHYSEDEIEVIGNIHETPELLED